MWSNRYAGCLVNVYVVLLIKIFKSDIKMGKKVILTIESVYTANAFQVGSAYYIAAGSETKPQVFLYNLSTGESSLVTGCPGGVMSFVPVPGNNNSFFSIMGLFPPFIGADAGVFMHTRKENQWTTVKTMELPFAHRCEVLNRNEKNYLFAASVSKYKENPPDWSKPGEVHLVELDENPEIPLKSVVIDNNLTRNHGMIKTRINGKEVVCISGREGIFCFKFKNGDWVKKQLFDHEVSEFWFIDLDGDGQDELVTIEPFHGEKLNVYKRIHNNWQLKYSDSLYFGHGLSAGFVNSEPVIVVGNRSESLALVQYKVVDFAKGKISREVLEEGVGPTQTMVFTDGNTDYILSANQKKNEVVLYY